MSTLPGAIVKKFRKKFRVLTRVRVELMIRPEIEIRRFAVLHDLKDHGFGGLGVLHTGNAEPILAHGPIGGESSAPVRSIGRLVVVRHSVVLASHAGIKHGRTPFRIRCGEDRRWQRHRTCCD